MEQNKNNMATASMVLGIISIVTVCCCCIGFILGALAVLFACLSRVDSQIEGRAKVGLITGIIGMALGAAAVLLYFIFTISEGYYYGYSYPDYYGYVPAIRTLVTGGLI